MSYLRHWFYLRSRPEPLRQASLLLMLAGSAGNAMALLATLQAHEAESRGEWRDCVRQLRSLLETGHSLSGACSLIDGILPPATVAAISVAEGGTGLTEVLLEESQRLGGRLPGAGNMQESVASLALWAGAVLTVLSVLSIFLCLNFVPKTQQIFEGFGVEVPPLMQAAVDFGSGWSTLLPLFVLPVCGCLVAAIVLIWKNCLRQLQLGYWPVLGHLPRYWTPTILRLVGLGMATGATMPRVLHAAVLMLPAGRAATRVMQLRDEVQAGGSLHAALESSGLIRGRERHFLDAAGQRGHADWGFRQLAMSIEQARRRRLRRLLAWLRPVVTVLVGVLVLYYCVFVFQAMTALLERLA